MANVRGASTKCVVCGEEIPEGYGLVCVGCERGTDDEHKEVEK